MPHEQVSIQGRYHYFLALDKHWPEALGGLRDDVLSVYSPNRHYIPSIHHAWKIVQSQPVMADLLTSLKAWAERFQVSEDWIFETALDTLLIYSDPLWRKHPTPGFDVEGQWRWQYLHKANDPPFSFEPENPLWSPPERGGNEEWDQFRKRIAKQFNAQLTDYRAAMERRFALKIEHDQLARDAKWTALYQKGMPAFQIAEQEQLPRHEDPKQTVFRAVSRFARSIALNLRSRAGRKMS